MIPCRINLLSPQKHQYLQTMVRFQFVKNILEIILIITCFIGIMATGGEWVLESYFSDLNATISSLQNRYTGTNKKIKTINEKLGQIAAIQKQYRPVTPLLPEITAAIPEKINLSVLNIDLENKMMILVGFAPTRDDLLRLQTQLTNIPWVENADVPVTQLTKKDNINFSFTVNLK